MEEKDNMPYVAKILRERLALEEKNLAIFEQNIHSEDFLTKRQAKGSISSNKSRVEELKNAIEHLRTFKKQKNER
jgi:hypothetical protein